MQTGTFLRIVQVAVHGYPQISINQSNHSTILRWKHKKQAPVQQGLSFITLPGFRAFLAIPTVGPFARAREMSLPRHYAADAAFSFHHSLGQAWHQLH